MILGAVQPSYLAWIPFFQRMVASDIFVYLDDVEFSKNSSHNRNRIKSGKSELLLTIPVLYAGNSGAKLCDIKIDYKKNWQKKHWSSLSQSYAKSEYWADWSIPLREVFFEKEHESLGSLNIELLEMFRVYLGITTKTVVSSKLGIDLKNNEKLIALCQEFKADRFLVKPNTEDYHPRETFQQKGIQLTMFHQQNVVYKQLGQQFLPGLSVLDFILNEGPGSVARLLGPSTQQSSLTG